MTVARARIRRFYRRLGIFGGRLRRDISWHLGGRGRRAKETENRLESKTWVFLVGCNNSGTTILHDLLVSSGMFSALPNEGQRYTRQLGFAERRGFERVWTEYLPSLRLTEADDTAAVPRLMHDWLYDARPRDKSLFIEKTTANSVRMRWLQKAFPHCYFIAIVRNGFAVAEGIRRKGHKDLTRSARHWSLVNQVMQSDSQFVQNYLEVRYEDIISSPDLIVDKIEEFLCLPSACLASKMSFAHLQNMNVDSLRRLNDDDRAAILSEAGPTLHEMGYADPSNAAIT